MVSSPDSGALTAYLRAIARFPRLTLDDERELAGRVQTSSDEEALRLLVESNLRFVVSCAKRYRGLGVSFLDLIHEGNLGLIEAARRFDPNRMSRTICCSDRSRVECAMRWASSTRAAELRSDVN
jgi:RNA polymerase primary sigma factor